MKTNKIKKAVLAVTLAASMTIPTVTFTSGVMTANAALNKPFCADTDNNGALNIDERQLYVSRSFYSTDSRDITIRKSNNQFCTRSTVKNLEVLSQAVISLEISGNGLKEEILDKLELKVFYDNKGKRNDAIYKNPEVVPSKNGSYIVKFDTVTYGDSFFFQTSEIEGVSNLTCTTAKFEPFSDSDEYLMLEVRPPEGEKLFIRIKNDPSIGCDKFEAWAKRLCMYANSMSKIVGFNLDTIYMDFDYPTYAKDGTTGVARSANWHINEQMDKYGFVAFGDWISGMEREQIASGRNVLTWNVLHEIGHSYVMGCSLNGKPLNFDSYYRFYDECLTNARFLTAVQNCDNLRNTLIHYRYFHDSTYKTYDDLYGTYDNIASEVCTYDSVAPLYFTFRLSRFDWDDLESFFAAKSDNDEDFKDSKKVAELLNQYTGIKMPINANTVKSTNYLKFANVLRKLMVLENVNYLNASEFNSFMWRHFSREGIQKVINYCITDNRFDKPLN